MRSIYVFVVAVFRAVVDELWPWRCIACGELSELSAGGKRLADHLCELCCDTLVPATPQIVSHYSDVFAAGVSAEAVYSYGGAIATVISRIKFGRDNRYIPIVAHELSHRIASYHDPKPDIVIPVPLHVRRLRQRGFNQAALLCRYAAKPLRLPVAYRAMKRIRATAPQAELCRQARFDNVDGAFVVTQPDHVAGKHVLLVDDVITTGCTAQACVTELQRAGAISIRVLALATREK